MIKIWWDLDGVIRDLSGAIFKEPIKKWDQLIEGKYEFYPYVAEHMEVIENAPTTEYYETIYSYYRNGFKDTRKMNILTHQPMDWRSRTEKWIKKYLSEASYEITYVNSSAEKLTHIGDGVLFDDHPQLVGTPHVITIDALYNRPDVDGCCRVTNGVQLRSILDILFNPKTTLYEAVVCL